ncbi:MAG: DUF1573 domain-containing protein [Planctomycetota bacterium]
MQLPHSSLETVLRLFVAAMIVWIGPALGPGGVASASDGSRGVLSGAEEKAVSEIQASGRQVTPGRAPPLVVVAEQSFVLGRIDDTRLFSVPVSNGGDRPLVISASETSCGCLSFQTMQLTIPPGESGAIEFLLEPRFGVRDTRQYQTATVTTNDPETESFTLGFEYWISEHELIVMPKSLDLVGDRDHPDAYMGIASGVVVINDMSPDGSAIVDTALSTDMLEVETWSVKHVDHVGEVRRSHRVRVTMRRGYAVGPVDEYVIVYTSNPSQPEITIPVNGEVLGNVVADPPAVFLGMIPPNTDFDRSILVRTVDGSPLVLDEPALGTDIEGVLIRTERESASSIRVYLSGRTYGPADYIGMRNRYRNQLRLAVKQPNEFLLPIAIKGAVWLGSSDQ